MAHGGKRVGSGRKSKAEELGMADIIDAAVSSDDWRDIFSKAKEQAKDGDKSAREWLTDRHFGKVIEKRINKELDKDDSFDDLTEDELNDIVGGEG